MFAGGEFYYDGSWMQAEASLATGDMTFLNGGKACLIVISNFLLDKGIRRILLPAYLCPTIVNTLEENGLTCEYYQINRDFSIDLDDLDHKVRNYQAVLYINYFGFLHPPQIQGYFQQLSRQGIIVIEDNAQAGFVRNPNGDFSFNSIRKFAPYDGGYLVSAHDITPFIERHAGIENRHLPVIREYRKSLADYLLHGGGSHERLQQLYLQAEQFYDSDPVVAGDPEERYNIERLDWESIRQVRRANYDYMLGLITGFPQLTPVFTELQSDNMPLGLPVYVSDVSRDWLFDALGNSGIGLTIHWDALLRDSRFDDNKVVMEMASRILTLVIDQRTTHEQMEFVARTLGHLLNSKPPGKRYSFVE